MSTLKEIIELGVEGTFPIASATVYYVSEVKQKTKQDPNYPNDRTKRIPIMFKDKNGNPIPAEHKDMAINDGSLEDNIFVEINKNYNFQKGALISFGLKVTKYKDKFYYKAINIKNLGGTTSQSGFKPADKILMSKFFEAIWTQVSDDAKLKLAENPELKKGLELVNKYIME